jgi:hypothetical protein
MRSECAHDLTRCSHGLYLGFTCWDCMADGLRNVRASALTENRCKGCGHPVGPWVDYCAQCASEDESDCW